MNQTIRVHVVEHGEDIEGNWALGSFFFFLPHKPDPFPAAEENGKSEKGDELVSAVWLSLPRASCGNVQVLQDLRSFLLSPIPQPARSPLFRSSLSLPDSVYLGL